MTEREEAGVKQGDNNRWHKAFKDGHENVEDEPRSGRLSSSRINENVACVKAVMDTDRQMNIRLIANEVRIPKTVIHRIVTEDVNMRKICAKVVPKNLTEGQKETRLSICQDIVNCLSTEPNMLNRAITGDESWLFLYDPEAERQSWQPVAHSEILLRIPMWYLGREIYGCACTPHVGALFQQNESMD
ncbi:histone-lysine N-methyltransferase SETMAR-like [Macrobrachium rosenbergii]|uniref:histone-lysine N-methyltransferase SETMAR-like n=1 Tax=Macrobrachium rosenbergii TaxID=79674 RepID=UPI0034D4E4AC